MAADPVVVDPEHYKVEFETERVRVLRVRYGPHEKSVRHVHPPTIGVVLSDVDFTFCMSGGKRQSIIGKAGQVIFFEEAFEHVPENSSDRAFEAVMIELKD